MGQFLQTNGDYNIKTGEGARITLDTGPGVGEVRVTGNLLVEGDTLTVSAENLNVEDNVIVVNSGETGVGITLQYAGIQVDRGLANDVSFLYDEQNDTWMLAEGVSPGPFNYTNSNLRLRRIYTNPATDDGDLTLIGSGTGVVKVIGTINYEDQVTHDDDVPNKKYVDDAIQNNPTFQVVRSDSRAIVFDTSTPIVPPLTPSNTIGPYTSQPTESLFSVIVNNKRITEFYENRIELGNTRDLSIFTETPTPSAFGIANTVVLQATNTNASIKLETNGTGKVQITYAGQFNHLNAALLGEPSPVSGTTLIYGDSPSIGKSGLYYVNTSTSDELVSKNRALLFSMIF